ncbi:nitroreductase [Actinoplanes sp. SE50]|uniref:nitroreductase family protein n=1 Tax=unclassified Actinoplanes TaxID=2626549 RepID=UPI00023EC708|nr:MULTISPECIES: nitroreductase family protein [unclassified Actinoplanes]AEV81450.1 NADPH-dependent oxidoreductase [Actinoplanes sp. SE50/110]ATO79853.1 nitroreductase [Actinoplanes sp. SE50]SLL97255.1 nitroreductase [Actinoplanes sp. SE50/110]
MEFDEVIRRRRMIRGYDVSRPVPPELIDKIVRHGLRAPSAGFAQGWSFLVLSSPDDCDRFWSATTVEQHTDAWLARMRTAPLIIIALSNKSVYLDRYAESDKGWADRDESRWSVPYWDIDTGFAALLMHLTAVNEELASCFIGLPAAKVADFRAAFGVPDEFTPVGALTVGYPGDDKRSPSLRRGHRPVDEVVHHGRWAAGGGSGRG